MTTPAVSVVLPFYNAAATLREAIISIQAQSLTDWELIAWDDGSTDDSPALVESLVREDDRIRLLRAEHRGIVAALQEACAQARAPFIARMDGDDVCWPTRLARQIDLMEARPELALCGTQVRMTGPDIASGRRRYEGWLNALSTPEDHDRDLFVECPVAHPTFFMRREAFEAVGGYEEHGWPEDYDLLLRFWRGGMAMAKVNEVLLDWYNTPGRLSMVAPRYEEASFRKLKKHYCFGGFVAEGEQFYQWGAGEVGKRWLRTWGERCPEAVVDVHPRKIGQKIHGFQVIKADQLPAPGTTRVLVMVGAPGARADIRAWFTEHGYRELRDYRFMA